MVSGSRNEGSWEVDELWAVFSAANDLAAALGGTDTFRDCVGSVYVVRAKRSSTDDVFVFRRNRFADTSRNVVTLFNECFSYHYYNSAEPDPKAVIVHELGHVWDNRPAEWGSEMIGRVVGNEGRPTENAYENRWEHWADLVEVSVYPGVSSQIRPTGVWHNAYWALAVRGWQGPVQVTDGGD